MAQNTRVWCRFTVKSKNGEMKLRIQDAPSERIEDVIDIFVKYFLTEETMFRAAGIHKNRDALAEFKESMTEMLKYINKRPHNVLICCLDHDNDVVGELVGASLTTIITKDDPEEKIYFTAKTKEMGDLSAILKKLISKYNFMKHLKVDSFLNDIGLVIHPDNRNHKIAEMFGNVRRNVCYETGIPLTGAWMTSLGTQMAAARNGEWKTVFEMLFEEFGKECGITFKDAPKTCKFMVAKPLPLNTKMQPAN